MASRLEQLEKFLEEDPSDPFNLYALALEYQKHDHQKALTLFKKLVADHPDYIPTYYHLGKLYLDLDDKENSLKIFECGINKAKAKQDFKALRELQVAHQEVFFE